MIGSRRLTIAATLLAFACVNLGPQADASRFYRLRSLSEPVPVVAGPSIGVGPVRLAAYLDRSRIVERIGPAEVRLLPREYWAAPLDDQIASVLAEEIRAVTGLRDVQQFPEPPSSRPDRRVYLEILRFEADALGLVELRARWSIHSTVEGSAVLATGEVSTTENADTQALPDRVEAMSRALATLAREITAGLR